LSHLRENPRDLAIAPLMAVVVAVIALPIKVWAAISMNRQGWLTRTAAGRVQGQREIAAPATLAPSTTTTTTTTTTPTDPEVRHAT
jgi:hyaluronan synthase